MAHVHRGEVVVSGTRRARALVTGIQNSLSGALALADQLDAQADRIEAASRSAEGLAIAPPTDGRVPSAVTEAAAVVRARCSGLASASWAASGWHGLAEVTDTSPAAPAPSHFRPGLWRLGRVGVTPLWPGGAAAEVGLAVPLLDAGNLQFDAGPEQRAAAVAAVRGLLTRILAAAPPGAVRLVVYDPHELGAGLAGFAPLRAVGVASPTLTTRTRLETALTELAADVGRITVDRLGGRFESLREREEAGLPRGEPWRVLVLLGWPALSDEGVRALEAVAGQGPACGVHVVAVKDRHGGIGTVGTSGRRAMEDLPNAEVVSSADLDGEWQCTLTGELRCVLDGPPPPAVVAAVTNAVALRAAREAARPPDARELLPGTLWGHDSAGGLSVPVATGADGPVTLTFDDDTVHGLVGGQAGSGKSTLLLDVVYGLAARYGPDQLRFHLLDFKEGLEFAQFAPRDADPFFLPHADTVGMDSDREFGVAVLRHVREQMQHRALAMRAVGARDLRGLRTAERSSNWPRIMVVVDEFQVMLTPLDTVSREAVSHLEVLARQGRAYGIHLLLASQTLSGIDALDATAGKRGSIFGQFALRVALRTSISESRVLLSTANEAAGGLAGVGQAIVNRRNGHPAGNELVRVAYPDPAMLAALRERIDVAVETSMPGAPPPRVFVGHAPAVLDDNEAFGALDGRPSARAEEAGGDTQEADVDSAPLAFVGVPLDLSPPAVGVRLSALPGRNLAVLGPLRREAVGVLHAAVCSVAAQLPPGGLDVDLVAVGPGTEAATEVLAQRLRAAGQVVREYGGSGLRRVLADAVADVVAREGAALGDTAPAAPPPLRLVVLFAADAGRAVLEARDPATRHSGLDDLRQLARRGPGQHVHLLGWWRGPSRLLDDLGAAHRDDVGAWVSVGVPGSDLFSLAGHRTVLGSTTPNRGVLFDRHVRAEPRTVVPFAPVQAPVPDVRSGFVPGCPSPRPPAYAEPR